MVVKAFFRCQREPYGVIVVGAAENDSGRLARGHATNGSCTLPSTAVSDKAPRDSPPADGKPARNGGCGKRLSRHATASIQDSPRAICQWRPFDPSDF
jgi:hypothetical protein